MEQKIKNPNSTNLTAETKIIKLWNVRIDEVDSLCRTLSFRKSGLADRRKTEGNQQPFHRSGLPAPTSPQLCCSPGGVTERHSEKTKKKRRGWNSVILGYLLNETNQPASHKTHDKSDALLTTHPNSLKQCIHDIVQPLPALTVLQRHIHHLFSAIISIYVSACPFTAFKSRDSAIQNP